MNQNPHGRVEDGVAFFPERTSVFIMNSDGKSATSNGEMTLTRINDDRLLSRSRHDAHFGLIAKRIGAADDILLRF